MTSERRQSARYTLTAVAEVKDTETSQTQHIVLSDLNHCGCFLVTPAPFPRGTRVSLRIEYLGEHFSAFGRVAYALPEGMGVVFSTIESDHKLILDHWLEAHE
jgi:hypothetical protein